MFRSTDGGGSWRVVNTGLTHSVVLALAINPATPATVYAGTYDGVYKSTDGGESSRTAYTGMTDTYVPTLAIDPKTSAILYAGTDGGGVFKSTDGGGRWTRPTPACRPIIRLMPWRSTR